MKGQSKVRFAATLAPNHMVDPCTIDVIRFSWQASCARAILEPAPDTGSGECNCQPCQLRTRTCLAPLLELLLMLMLLLIVLLLPVLTSCCL